MECMGGKGPAKGVAAAAAEGRLEEAEGRQTGGVGGHQPRRDLTAWDLFILFYNFHKCLILVQLSTMASRSKYCVTIQSLITERVLRNMLLYE